MTTSTADVSPGTVRESASFAGTVRATRAGDRFHYVWAATRALRLIDARTRLQMIAIEGTGGNSTPGDEVIDVAEYYGPAVGTFDEVVVRQLKYSTVRAEKPLGLSELGETLQRFAVIDTGGAKAFGVPAGTRISFSVVTNRPIADSLKKAVVDIAAGNGGTPKSTIGRVLRWLGLPLAKAAPLCARIALEGEVPTLVALRAALDAETADVIGGMDRGVPAELVERVSKIASGESVGGLIGSDVYATFGTSYAALHPAPSMLELDPNAIHREAYTNLADQILGTVGPHLVTAAAGSGKSTFAAQLPRLLEGRAEVVVYDCFGNGTYRKPGTSRHRLRDGLIQIVTELAGRGLCPPMIPLPSMDDEDLLRLFRRRLIVAAEFAQHQSGVPVILVVDAADNAATEADARGGEKTFVRDLLTMAPISGVHIVMTSRPERVPLLNAPAGLIPSLLLGYSASETRAFLDTQYEGVSSNESEHFHALTGGNPRLEATFTGRHATMLDALDALAGLPRHSSDTLNDYLENSLAQVLEAAGSEREKVDLTARLIANLRPSIPIAVLERLTGLSSEFIRGFVIDVGGGLLIGNDAVQFRDEPTETFFRTHYALDTTGADAVIEPLAQLAVESAYAASCLPQLLWEAGRMDDLMELAAAGLELEGVNEVERRQVAHLRIEFGLKTALRLQRPSDVVRLAMLAGAAVANSERRYTLLRDHPDLAGEIHGPGTLDEIVAGKLLPSEWPGSTYAAEACMLAMQDGRTAEALSRNRLATAAAQAWVQTDPDTRRGSKGVEVDHVVSAALALVFTGRPGAAASYLGGWAPARVPVEAARRVGEVLVSRGRLDDVAALALASSNSAVHVGLAAAMGVAGIPLGADVARKARAALAGKTITLRSPSMLHERVEDDGFAGVTWIAASAVRAGVVTRRQAVLLLTKYLPRDVPPRLGERYGRTRTGLLNGYALRGFLRDQPLAVSELVAPEATRQESDEVATSLTRVLPWLHAWAAWAVGERLEPRVVDQLIDSYPTRDGYYEPTTVRRFAAPLIIAFARTSDDDKIVQKGIAVLASAGEHSGTYFATQMIAASLGDDRFATAAYATAEAIAERLEVAPQTAEDLVEELVALTRALFRFGPDEARLYFARAVELASRVGYDASQRWSAIVEIAARVRPGDEQHEALSVADRLARDGERLLPLLGEGFDQARLTEVLAEISGPHVFEVVSGWRERDFGDLDWEVSGLASCESLLGSRREIAAALTFLSPRMDFRQIATSLTQSPSGDGRDDVLHAAASRQGIELEAPARVQERQPISSSFGIDDATREAERASALKVLRSSVSALDLTSADGMAEAARLIAESNVYVDGSLLADIVVTLPANRRAAAVRAFAGCEGFERGWMRSKFLGRLLAAPIAGVAYRAAVVDLARDHLRDEAASVLVGLAHDLDLDRIAALIGRTRLQILNDSLAAVDPLRVMASSDHCYRLASTAVLLLDSADATATLAASLDDLEAALDFKPVSSTPSVPVALEHAVASFLWSALGDPRASTRWRAMHATRFLVEWGADDVIGALAEIAVNPNASDAYRDPRFLFYEMHAVEALLTTIERVTVDQGGAAIEFTRFVESCQTKYPDHARIQRLISEIAGAWERGAAWDGAAALRTAATIVLKPPISLARFDRRRPPSPMSEAAVKTAFHFHYDLEESWFARLAECFEVPYAEVMSAASDLIFDEWGAQDVKKRTDDPRRAAGAIGDQETGVDRYGWPNAEDLQYYFTYHAALTVAGRLARKSRPYIDPDEPDVDYVEWLRRFDLRREDRRWMSDARRAVPSLALAPGPSKRGDWMYSVTRDDFPRAFLGAPGWVTLDQSAGYEDYGSSERIGVSSALVDPSTAGSLVRALQGSASFSDYRIPESDDEDFSFDADPFVLKGWMRTPYAEGGVDERDPFATHLRVPTARPSDEIVAALGLVASVDGMTWTARKDSDVHFVAESWAAKEGREPPRGPAGYRLRATDAGVRLLTEKTGLSLLVEVRVDRNDDSPRYSATKRIEYLDDYVTFFLYDRRSGWRDYRGDPVIRPPTR